MKRLSTVLVAVVALFSAACGSDDTGGAIDQGDATAEASFNDADVAFAQGMIPHHQQAIEMSDMAAEKAESAEVKGLAAKIKDAQAPEIETMTGWLQSWDQPVPSGMEMGGEGGGMGGMNGMSGMMSAEQMGMLEAASGPEFDQLFLTGMREHHAGAITMAEQELEMGEYPEAKELAQEIIDAQRTEIEEIDRLLAA
ncbi:MAG: DUF305 domain-containing protein [Actinomycetota bacterium]|jgi:uncharacterized protein (DUF305 family)|nr:DUF305 domain-containing protein [Actinomycetota bacterium]